MIKGSATTWQGVQGGRESGRQACHGCLRKLGGPERNQVESTLAEYQLR